MIYNIIHTLQSDSTRETSSAFKDKTMSSLFQCYLHVILFWILLCAVEAATESGRYTNSTGLTITTKAVTTSIPPSLSIIYNSSVMAASVSHVPEESPENDSSSADMSDEVETLTLTHSTTVTTTVYNDSFTPTFTLSQTTCEGGLYEWSIDGHVILENKTTIETSLYTVFSCVNHTLQPYGWEPIPTPGATPSTENDIHRLAPAPVNVPTSLAKTNDSYHWSHTHGSKSSTTVGSAMSSPTSSTATNDTNHWWHTHSSISTMTFKSTKNLSVPSVTETNPWHWWLSDTTMTLPSPYDSSYPVSFSGVTATDPEQSTTSSGQQSSTSQTPSSSSSSLLLSTSNTTHTDLSGWVSSDSPSTNHPSTSSSSIQQPQQQPQPQPQPMMNSAGANTQTPTQPFSSSFSSSSSSSSPSSETAFSTNSLETANSIVPTHLHVPNFTPRARRCVAQSMRLESVVEKRSLVGVGVTVDAETR